MPRGSTKKGEESKARLLRAAAREFAEKGFHDARISAIVAEAGLAQGAFYLYFPGKEAIFAELISNFRTRLRELGSAGRLVTPLQGADAVVAQTRANLEGLFRFLGADPHLARIGLLQAPDAEDVRRELTGMILQNLTANQAAGHHRPDLPLEVAAEVMAGAVERAALRWVLIGQADPAVLAAQVADVLLHGILAYH